MTLCRNKRSVRNWKKKRHNKSKLFDHVVPSPPPKKGFHGEQHSAEYSPVKLHLNNLHVVRENDKHRKYKFKITLAHNAHYVCTFN